MRHLIPNAPRTCSAVVLHDGDTPVNGGHLGHTGHHLVHLGHTGHHLVHPGHTGHHLVHLVLVEEEESALLVSGLYTCSAVVLHDGDTSVNGGHLGHTGRHLVHQALAEGGNRSTDLAGVFHTVLGFKMTKKTYFKKLEKSEKTGDMDEV